MQLAFTFGERTNVKLASTCIEIPLLQFARYESK